jgi:hypothetical protein
MLDHGVFSYWHVITRLGEVQLLLPAALLTCLALLNLQDTRHLAIRWLQALSVAAGLIPIVGNLICNSVMAIAGVSVSASVGLACLIFLIAIHKTEYVINAKILGKQTNTAAWELLTVMFIGEAVFGLPGLVAAPLYYAYSKKELQAARLV